MKEGRKRGENVSSSPCSWPSSDWCSSRLKPVEWEALLSLFLSPQVVARHPGNAAFPVPCVVFFIISFFPFFSGFSILPHRKKKRKSCKRESPLPVVEFNSIKDNSLCNKIEKDAMGEVLLRRPEYTGCGPRLPSIENKSLA